MIWMPLHRLSITQTPHKSKIQIISTRIQPTEHAIPYYEREIYVWISEKCIKTLKTQEKARRSAVQRRKSAGFTRIDATKGSPRIKALKQRLGCSRSLVQHAILIKERKIYLKITNEPLINTFLANVLIGSKGLGLKILILSAKSAIRAVILHYTPINRALLRLFSTKLKQNIACSLHFQRKISLDASIFRQMTIRIRLIARLI